MNYQLYDFVKRFVDLIGSILGIIIFGIPMLVIAVARKLEGSKRVIFSQTRVGKGRKVFKLHKFSSMVTETDEEEQEFFRQLEKSDPHLLAKYRRNNFKFADGEDPRITKVGRVIRRFSIDELPQFFDVARGEMSLVGPRAYKPDELEYKLKEYPQCRKDVEALLTAKPGITGLWQISGRSELDFPKGVALDAAYARRKSLLEDFRIILKTPFAMISGKGAY